ncbi:pickpocket protein 19 isoform X2 [Halyomorpha halys]|uniref:pickpocket protein 19 isoform X2 n=1 Tax=Halyomorpha halys TaxID=286706 RepID=UPI000D0C7E87|nr:pickpocket protein 19-like isoform X2 [Halyomorpha halys]
MKRYLQLNRKYIKMFDNLNITDFMLAVLPSCNELFIKCIWHGQKINCCEVFDLQRTEEGFCYAFNSFSADDKKICSLYEKHYTKNEKERKCMPQYLTFAGVHSGLTIFTKTQKIGDRFFLSDRDITPGIVVILSAVHQLPEAGGGTLLRTNIPGEFVQIEVSTSMIFSSRIISRLDKEDRGCTLSYENDSFTKYYSLRSCLIGCRHEFIMRVCGCQLYFFYDPEKATSKPLCKLSQLWCVVRYAEALKLKTPSKYAFSKPSIKDFPDCSCQTACDSLWYDLGIKRKNATAEGNITGHLSIYYKTYGAIKYLRKFTFSREQLIVSLGGVGNLFIGASFISFSEVLYYFIRSLCEVIYIRILKSTDSRIHNSISSCSSEFVN